MKNRKRPIPSEIEGELVAASTVELPNALLRRASACFTRSSAMAAISEIDGNKLTVEFEKAGQKKVVASFVEGV